MKYVKYFFILLFCAVAVRAEEYRYMERLWQQFRWGSLGDVAVQGHYAYCSDIENASLVVFDLSDPSNPTEVGGLGFMEGNYSQALAVSGDYAYLAADQVGVKIINIANPEAPFGVGLWETPLSQIAGLTVDGNYLYAACRGSGLLIVDVSNPDYPEAIFQYHGLSPIMDVVIRYPFAYVSSMSELLILNISNPAAPTLVGSITFEGADFSIRIAVSGDYAYCPNNAGVYIYDISNPSAPVLVNTYGTPGQAYDIAIRGSQAWISDGTGGLRVLDISIPTAPVEAGLWLEPDVSAWFLDMCGDYACVSTWDDLHIIDVSDPQAPVLAGAAGPPPTRAMDVALSGDYAYFASGTHLEIYGVSSAASPMEVGNYDWEGWPDDPTHVTVEGDIAYLLSQEHSGRTLQIIDISNPALPVLLGSCFVPPGAVASGIAVNGDFVYTTHAYIGDDLHVLDVSNPASPYVLSGFNTPGLAHGIVVSGNLAYVADGEQGLRIFDITNPAAPTVEGFYNTSGNACGVALYGDYAYVADSSSGLQILDVSFPSLPIPAAFYETPGTPQDVVIEGNFAFVADGYSGIRVLDLGNPLLPVELGFYNTPGYTDEIAVNGNVAYVAEGSYFGIYEFTACEDTLLVAPEVAILSEGQSVYLWWHPVTHTVTGCPYSATHYLVFYSPFYHGPYYYHSGGVDTVFVHQWALAYAEGMFYKVFAHAGELPDRSALPENGVLTMEETLARLNARER